MYTLNTSQFGNYDIDRAEDFVSFWQTYYRYSVKFLGSSREIDYFHELNVGSKLSEGNIRNLLRWKDPRYLTSQILSGPNKGGLNGRVERVIEATTELNRFRYNEISEDEFRSVVSRMFPSGPIWQIFIFHICKPISYPIADQHVYRSFSYHRGRGTPNSWESYLVYADYFDSICNSCNFAQDDMVERKRVDNALMAYGQFLKNYAVR